MLSTNVSNNKTPKIISGSILAKSDKIDRFKQTGRESPRLIRESEKMQITQTNNFGRTIQPQNEGWVPEESMAKWNAQTVQSSQRQNDRDTLPNPTPERPKLILEYPSKSGISPIKTMRSQQRQMQ